MEVSPLILAVACWNLDYKEVRRCLISDQLIIDDTKYQYEVNTHYFSDLIHNDSALIMRAVVGSGSLMLVRIMLNEDRINPGAMNNLALRDAILSGKKDIAQLLGSDKRVSAPRVYYTKSLWRLDQVIASKEVLNIFDEKLKNALTDNSKEIVEDEVFKEYYALSVDEVIKSIGDDINLVRNTHLHRCLLLTYRNDKAKRYIFDGLCLFSNMKERQWKYDW